MSEGGAIIGEVRNGPTVQLKVGKWSGSAGVQVRDGFSEVAYIGRAPTRFPQAVTINGDEANATASRKSADRRFAVLIVDWVPPAD